jgi:hypothetical protein
MSPCALLVLLLAYAPSPLRTPTFEAEDHLEVDLVEVLIVCARDQPASNQPGIHACVCVCSCVCVCVCVC